MPVKILFGTVCGVFILAAYFYIGKPGPAPARFDPLAPEITVPESISASANSSAVATRPPDSRIIPSDLGSAHSASDGFSPPSGTDRGAAPAKIAPGSPAAATRSRRQESGTRVIAISLPQVDPKIARNHKGAAELILELPKGMRLPAVLLSDDEAAPMTDVQAKVAGEIAETFVNEIAKTIGETADEATLTATWDEAMKLADQRFAGFFGEREWIRRSIIAGREALGIHEGRPPEPPAH